MAGVLFYVIFPIDVVFCYFHTLQRFFYFGGKVNEGVYIVRHKGFSTKHDNGC